MVIENPNNLFLLIFNEITSPFNKIGCITRSSKIDCYSDSGGLEGKQRRSLQLLPRIRVLRRI